LDQISSVVYERIAFNAALLSALNSTFYPPAFNRNRALMLPFRVACAPYWYFVAS
jgi:hypothetical protein